MAAEGGFTNLAYAQDSPSIPGEYYNISTTSFAIKDADTKIAGSSNKEIKKSSPQNSLENNRDKWGNDIEFLFSCIALSVGLGNVWRFPFTALQNGGGAFVLPYIIVLFLVGKPVYYMEMLLGQFSSRGIVKVYDFSPIMRGVGYGQVISTGLVTTYYASLMALTIRYLIASFSSILPWSYCRTEWMETCVDSHRQNTSIEQNQTTIGSTSAELYFLNEILREKDTINDGIGYPNWDLVLCLALSWLIVGLILIKGIRSSGKVSYFLAIFPYIIMCILLIRALTLPGAFDGILYFLTPQWNKLLSPKVWYAAVTQVFFSLAICFGNIVMYASYNRFSYNIYRDVTIVTILDTFTSLLAGVIIFGILGNLAYELNQSDISKVIKGGSGLAFMSYPDAIAKFEYVPQVFSALFFFMLLVLGIGSNVGMASCVMTVIRDKFTKTRHWMVAIGVSVTGFCIGLVYLTPGGQYVLNLIDFYGASFVAFVLAIAELLAIGWIYGVKRLCKDAEFMLGISTGIYWRICWAIITPALMIAILLYSLIEFEPLTYGNHIYPNGAHIFGWCLSAFGILQLPLWALYAVHKQPNKSSLMTKISLALKPDENWGPSDPTLLKKYKSFIVDDHGRLFRKNGIWFKFYDNIFG